MELTFADPGRISHAYIIDADSRESSLHAAVRIAAAALCSAGKDVPCGECRNCRKVFAGIHPDVIYIEREEASGKKGSKKKFLTVEQIRAMMADASILPNEAEKKVYILPEADSMNPEAQNAALKGLEEPPAWVVFALCVRNAGLLLPTVRSRCVELDCGEQAGESPVDPAADRMARGYLEAAATGSARKLAAWCLSRENTDNAGLTAFVERVQVLCGDMLCGREPADGLSTARLVQIVGLMEKCRTYLKVNVGGKHIIGLLAVDTLPAAGNRGKEN